MPSSSKSKVRRVGKPLLLLSTGVGATAKGVWRLARAVPTRRTRGPPLASLSAATMHVDPYWSRPDSGAGSSSASDVGTSAAAAGALCPGLPQLQLPSWLAPWAGQQDRQADTDSSSSSSRVIEMYNPDNSFPMAITPVQQRQASSSSSSWRAAHTSHHHHEHIHHSSSSSSSRWYGEHHSGSSSSSSPDVGSTASASGTGQHQQHQQHQLLTIGCRHWGNWWDGRGLLRVKIYDFAIFVDGEQAGAFLPATISSRSNRSSSSKQSKLPQQPLLLECPPAHQQQQAEASSSGNWLTSAFASLLPALPLGGLGFTAAGAGSSSSPPAAALAAADCSTVPQRLSRKERRQQRRQQQAAAKLLQQQRRAAAAAAAATGAGAGAALTAGTAAAARSAQQPQQQQQQQLSSAAVDSTDLPGLVKASSSGVGMSLVLKAAREVPLHLLAEEYEKVLRRRLARVGGNDVSDAAALGQLLDSFRHPERLPSVVRGGGGGSVRKGAMIVFERDGDSGTIVARVGPHVLGTVSGSPKLGEALFDLYLGQQPVSQAAKDAAADALARIASFYAATTSSSSRGGDAAAAAPYYLPQGRHEQIRCRQQTGATGTAGGGSGLGVADLAACMLHLE